MDGKLYVARRKSAKGNYYKCVAFQPENVDTPPIIISFDEMLMYKLAELEGCLLREYAVDEVDK